MKTVSLLLIFAMLISFAACGTDPAGPADSGDGTSAPASDSVSDTTAVPDPMDVLPAVTFEDVTFKIWGDVAFSTNFFVVDGEETEGDVVAEAVTDRTNAVQDRFGITIEYDVTLDNVWRGNAVIRQSILGGDSYDLLEDPVTHLTPMTTLGCFTDLSDGKYQDFSEACVGGERHPRAGGWRPPVLRLRIL